MFSFFDTVIEFLQNWQDSFISFQSPWYDFLEVLIEVFTWLNTIVAALVGRNVSLYQYIMPAVFAALVNEWRKRNLGK